MADDPHLPSPGDVLAGKYRIERLIGRGGMGAVFAAQHILLNQRVAVKLLLGELVSSHEATARFMNEARAAAQIQGENVARVLDIGQLPTGTPYMVLEFLEGSDLSGILHQRGVLSVNEVADYALQALDALAQAHAAGIVHRDLKPANLFLAKRHDGTSVVKVLDFGISKNLSPINGTPQGMTNTRAILGSPEYMSPEQLRTPRGVDARTDIWSLGVILYELLTGRMPFTGESIGELFMQIMEATPPSVRALRPEVPAALDAAIARCLSRDPNARYQTVKELASVLRVFASDQMRAIIAARESSPGLASSGQLVAQTMPMVATGTTAAPWANTGTGSTTGPTGIPDGKRARVVGIIGASVVGLIVGFVGIFAVVKHTLKTDVDGAGAAGLAISSSASAPAPVTIAALPTSEGARDAGAGAKPASAPAAQSQAARVGSPAVAAPPATAKPAPSPPPPATPPVSTVVVPVQPLAPTPPAAIPFPAPAPAPAPVPAAKNNCNPNYYFDKDGHKHFKPECF